MFSKNKPAPKYQIIEHKPVEMRLKVEVDSFSREISSWHKTDKLTVLPPYDYLAHISKQMGTVQIFYPFGESFTLSHPAVEFCFCFVNIYVTCSISEIRFWLEDKLIEAFELFPNYKDQKYTLRTTLLEGTILHCWITDGIKIIDNLEFNLGTRVQAKRKLPANMFDIKAIPKQNYDSTFAIITRESKTDNNRSLTIYRNDIRNLPEWYGAREIHPLGDMNSTTMSESGRYWADYSTTQPGIKIWKVIGVELRSPLKTLADAENPYWFRGKLIYQQKQSLRAFDPETLAIDILIESIPNCAQIVFGDHGIFELTPHEKTIEVKHLKINSIPYNSEMKFFACQELKAQPRTIPTPIPKALALRFKYPSDLSEVEYITPVTNHVILLHTSQKSMAYNLTTSSVFAEFDNECFFTGVSQERFAKINHEQLEIYCAKTGNRKKSLTWDFKLKFNVDRCRAALDGNYLLVSGSRWDILKDEPEKHWAMIMDLQSYKSIFIPVDHKVWDFTMTDNKQIIMVHRDNISIVNINFENLSCTIQSLSGLLPQFTDLFIYKNNWITLEGEKLRLWQVEPQSSRLTFQQDIGKTNCRIWQQGNLLFFGYQTNQKILMTEFNIETLSSQQQYIGCGSEHGMTILPDKWIAIINNTTKTLELYAPCSELKSEVKNELRSYSISLSS